METITTPPPIQRSSSNRLRQNSSLSQSLSVNLPMHELLLMSPSPTFRKSARTTRFSERLDMTVDDTRKSKSRVGIGSSPRVGRREKGRRRERADEEREVEDVPVKVIRKKRNSGKSKKEQVVLALSPKADEQHHCNLDRIGQVISDLVMWNDVAKSSLWFGFGCLSFLSSCFAKGINFSIFSFMSQFGLLALGLSFISNTICQRNTIQNKRELKLTEKDILKAGRVILPMVNFAISKTSELFSGEPTMTLKVAPFLLIGAEYGHLLTLRRLCALGFFISFSFPKLCSSYCPQIKSRVDGFKSRAIDTWGGCSHKKIVAASAATAFWNLTSIRTRMFAAFIVMVILRYYRQHSQSTVQVEEAGEELPLQTTVRVEEASEEELKQSKALVVVEPGSEKQFIVSHNQKSTK